MCIGILIWMEKVPMRYVFKATCGWYNIHCAIEFVFYSYVWIYIYKKLRIFN